MAGLRGVCMLLEKHRDVICEDLNVDEVVPELVNKGILGVEEEKALVNEDLGRAKAELLVSQLSKKGFAAFQEFCHVLEKSHPHLLTCFLMDVAGKYHHNKIELLDVDCDLQFCTQWTSSLITHQIQ